MPPRTPSLRGRLSRWLAIQTFVGLALVSLAVYSLTVADLRARQQEALRHKKDLVVHVLDETSVDKDLALLKHKFDDFFLGHPDIALALRRPDGSMLYDNVSEANLSPSVRHIEFRYPDWEHPGAFLSARIVLNKAPDDHMLSRLAATLLVAALLGALAVSWGSFVLVRVALGPVHLLVDQARNLTADKLGHRLDGSGQPLELQPLIAQFNDLLQRLGKSYDQLEGFNADVAHELRTPLATMIASTEIALRRPPDERAIPELLGSTLEELRRMSAIVNDMLFLSHADSGAVARRECVPSVGDLARSVVEYHEAALQEAGLEVVVHGDAAGEFDAALLKRALSNLLGNATRYATPRSTIDIRIEAAPPGRIGLLVVNSGSLIAPGHLPRIFDRFYREDAARSGAHANHGLGLSIVAAIARMHGGEPTAWSRSGQSGIGFTMATAGDA